jgi:transcriptional regulator with XRE-family HTH domain
MIFLTREEWMKRLGENLRARRLRANLSQQTLAERSGLSLNAVKNMESGRGASVFSLVSACRTLGVMDWIDSIAPESEASPLEIAKRGRMRLRATPRRKEAVHV